MRLSCKKDRLITVRRDSAVGRQPHSEVLNVRLWRSREKYIDFDKSVTCAANPSPRRLWPVMVIFGSGKLFARRIRITCMPSRPVQQAVPGPMSPASPARARGGGALALIAEQATVAGVPQASFGPAPVRVLSRDALASCCSIDLPNRCRTWNQARIGRPISIGQIRSGCDQSRHRDGFSEHADES